jgi:hypothetical protein
MRKLYDPECYELAARFLTDEPDIDTIEAREALAEAIQLTIDDELTYMRVQRETMQ